MEPQQPEQPSYIDGDFYHPTEQPGSAKVATCPERPGQITSPDKLEKGATYAWHNEECSPTPRVAVTDPYKDENGRWRIKFEQENGTPSYPPAAYLSSLGVVPNPDGTWNSSNWLERVD